MKFFMTKQEKITGDFLIEVTSCTGFVVYVSFSYFILLLIEKTGSRKEKSKGSQI